MLPLVGGETNMERRRRITNLHVLPDAVGGLTYFSHYPHILEPLRDARVGSDSSSSHLGIPRSVDILDHIHSLPADQQEEAHSAIREIERQALKDQKPHVGLVELMDYLQSRGIRKAICTRSLE